MLSFTCPMSPAVPSSPDSVCPLVTSPAPMPLDHLSPSTVESGCRVASPSTSARASFSTTIGTAQLARSRSSDGYWSQPGRIAIGPGRPVTGEIGPGSAHQSWTAAVALDWVLRPAGDGAVQALRGDPGAY